MENAPAALYTTYKNGRFRIVNQTFCNIIGYTADELQKKKIKEIIHPDDRNNDKKNMLKLWNGEISQYQVEKRFVSKNGKIVNGLVRMGILKDSENTKRYFIGDLEDITEHKQVKNESKGTEVAISDMIQYGEDIIYRLDAEGKIVYVNRAVESLGYSPEEWVGTDIMEFVHPDDKVKAEYRINERRTGERSTKSLEIRVVPKEDDGTYLDTYSSDAIDGRIFTLNAEGYYEFEKAETKNFIGTLGFARDITDKKRAEKSLRQLEKNYHSLIEQTSDAVFCYECNPPISLDLSIEEQVKQLYECVLVECNDVCAKSYGYMKAEEVIGKKLTDVFSTSHKSLDTLFRNFVQENYRIIDGEVILVELDGSKRYYLNNGYGIKENGNLMRVWGTFRDITWRKEAEEALRASEVRYRGIVEDQTEFIVHWKPDGILTFANRSYLDYYNLTLEKAIGKSFYPLISEDDRESVKKRIEALSVTNQVNYGEHKVIKPDGSIGWNAWTDRAIFNDKNEIVEYHSVGRDITDRKITEEKLRESNETTQTLLDATTDAALMVELDGTIISLNNAAASNLGGSKKEIIGKNAFDFFPPELTKSRKKIGEEIVKTGRPRRFQDIRAGKHYDNSVYPVFGADGKIIRLAVFSQDITDSKKAKQALKEQENFTETVLNAMMDTFFVFDPNIGKAIRWNKTFRDISGYSDEEISAMKAPEDWYSKEDIKKAAKAIQKIRTEGHATLELSLITKNGVSIPTEYSAAMIKNGKNTPEYIIAIGRDITERKKAETDLQLSRNGLQMAQEIADLGNWSWDIVSNKESWSIQFYRILGYSPMEIKASRENFRKMIFHYDAELEKKAFEHALSSPGNMYEAEYRIERPDGSIRFVHSRGKVTMWDEKCNPQYMICTTQDITDRKKSEIALKESEEHFRFLTENAKDVIYHMSLPDGNYEYVSPASEKIFGYTPEEFYQFPKLIEEIIHPAWRNYFKVEWQNLIEGKHKKFVEYMIVHKSGEERWLYQRNSLLWDEDENPIAVEGIISDITERKLAEEALKESEEKHRSLFEIMAQGAIFYDSGGRIFAVNPAAESILGITSRQLQGKTHKDLIGKFIYEDGKDFPNNSHPAARALKTGKEVKNVVMGIFHPGENNYRWINVNAIPQFRAGDSKPYRVFTTLEDITARKRIEDALVENEKYLAKAQEIAHLGHWKIEILTNEITGSDEFFRIFGLDRNEKSPHAFAEVVHSEDREHYKFHIRRGLEYGEPWDIEYRLILNDGKEKWVHAIGEVVKNNNGDIIQLIGTVQDRTRHKNTEKLLNNERDRAQSYLDIAGVILIVINVKGQVTLINKKGCDVVGCRENEIIGKNWFDNFLPERIRKEVKSVSKKIFEGNLEPVKHYINPILNSDGEEKIISWYNSEIKDDSGNIIGLLSSGEDITERVKSESREKKILQNMSILSETAMEFVDLPYQINIYSYIAEKIKNLTGDSIVAVSSYDRTSGKLMVQEMRGLGKISKKVYEIVGGKFVGKKFEIKMQEKNGFTNRLEKIPLSLHEVASEIITKNMGSMLEKLINLGSIYSMGMSVEGQLFGNVAVLTRKGHKLENINLIETFVHQASVALRRRIAEEALRESDKRYQDLYNNAPDMFASVDASTEKIIQCNETFIKATGFSRKEIIGRSIFDIYHPDCLERVKKDVFPQFIKTGEIKNEELQLVRKNGSIIDVVLNASSVRDDYGGILYSRSSWRDVSEIKKTDREKRNLEEQLYHAQKMESIGRLAGGIAHDFNNILASIMGYAEFLKMEFNDTSKFEGKAADVILKGAERAANLTKQLLGFARKGKYNPVPLNINDIIKETVKVSENIFEKNITVSFELKKDLDVVEADESQMDQVLTNLIINARDAMPDGGDLIFKTENEYLDEKYRKKNSEHEPGDYVKISVADSGIGMPKEVKDKIFEPFYTTKGTEKGTGLGLATVYGIVQNHKGYIECDSESGKGTTFIIYLPVSGKKIVKSKKDLKVVEGDATILVVEDEEHLRMLAVELLEELGYTVIEAENGKKAVEICKKSKDKINLILLDMIMPVMPGRETYYEIRRINPDMKVLLMSGFSQDEKASDLLNEGACGFIQKPFRLHDLSKVISEALSS